MTKNILDLISSNSIFEETMKSLYPELGMVNPSISAAETMKSLYPELSMVNPNASTTETVKSLYSELSIANPSDPIAEAVKSLYPELGMVNPSDSIAETMKFLNPILEMVSPRSSISEAMKSFNSIQDLIGSNSIVNTLVSSDAFESTLRAMSQPLNLSSAIGIIEREFIHNNYEQLDEFNLQAAESSLFPLAETEDSFEERFARIPHALQLFLLFTLLQIVLPQLNNISSNLLTPYFENYISNTSISESEKLRSLKKINFKDFELPSKKLRFISRSNVFLRSKPSTKSEMIDLLRLGQLVVFSEKKRNWTKVVIQYEGGGFATGWVFTRYVAKFKK